MPGFFSPAILVDVINENSYHYHMSEQSQNDRTPGNDKQTRNKQVLPRIESSTLFKGVQEIIIDHMGQEYHLRLTNQGKLLLTK
jgi:hemin uptake protein HemP